MVKVGGKRKTRKVWKTRKFYEVGGIAKVHVGGNNNFFPK